MKVPLDLFASWLKNKSLKDSTIENYVYYFCKFTHELFNQESVSEFLSKSQNQNSVSRGFLINFKRFLLINYKSLNISDEYFKEISQVELPKITGRIKNKLVNPLRHEQIFLLEKYLETEQEKVQLLLSYFCGLRLGELLKIEILSFNWDEWKENMSQIGECKVFGKGDKEGIALVPPFLMERISNFIKNKNFLSIKSKIFVKEKLGRGNARTWQRRLGEAGIKSGITKLDEYGKPIPGTKVHPHRLRHSFANHLLKDKKLDIRYIQEALRHSSIQSTQIYTNVDKEELKKQLAGA